MKGLFKRTYLCGIGGMKCPCCGKRKDPRARQLYHRQAKRRLAKHINKIEKEGVVND